MCNLRMAAVLSLCFYLLCVAVQAAIVRQTAQTCTVEGLMPQTNPCESCVCHGGSAFCASQTDSCGPTVCVDPIQLEGLCCPICPNGPNCKTTGGVLINGTEHVWTDQYTECWCVYDGPYRALCRAS